MVAMILAWQRDLHVLHHSQGSIVANCSYLGGSVPIIKDQKVIDRHNYIGIAKTGCDW